MPRKIKFTIHAARWFSKVNGNTYHACRIVRHRDGKTLHCPFQYGYGEQYRTTALLAMAQAKWIPPKYRRLVSYESPDYFCYERENNYPIEWFVTDGLKRDCVAVGNGD